MGQPAGAAAQGMLLMRSTPPVTSQPSLPRAFGFHHQRVSHETASATSAAAALSAGPVRRRQKLHFSPPVRRLSTLSAFSHCCSGDSLTATTSRCRARSLDSSFTSSSGANFESQSKDINPHGLVFGTRLPSGFYAREGFGFGPSMTDRPSSRSVVAQAGKNGIRAPERVVAALGYVLPFFDGIQYGRYFFLQYPMAEGLLRPLYPLLAAYKGFPYSNFIAFFSLYLLVVRNPSISRYVRFNAMQAVVLDVLLILPTLVERTFAPRGGWGFQLLIIFYNTVFLFLVACFLFGVVSCILGKTPRLPIVADAADAQV